jgi:WD40 repeat protein
MQIISIEPKVRITSIAFSPTGREIAVACGNGYIRIWDRSTGDARQRIWIAPNSDGHEIAYLDEDRLVIAGWDICWWDISANQQNQIISHLGPRQLCLSPDRTCLAVAGDMGFVDNLIHGVLVFRLQLRGIHPRSTTTRDFDLGTTGGIAYSPDGKYLATGHRLYDDYIVRLCDVPSGNTIQVSKGWRHMVRKLAFSPDGKILAGAVGPSLRIWDVEQNREVARRKPSSKHFQGMSFTADGRYLLTVSNDETLRVWDTRSWQEHSAYTWKIGRLLNIALSPDGLVAAAGSDRGKIVIWDVDC